MSHQSKTSFLGETSISYVGNATVTFFGGKSSLVGKGTAKCDASGRYNITVEIEQFDTDATEMRFVNCLGSIQNIGWKTISIKTPDGVFSSDKFSLNKFTFGNSYTIVFAPLRAVYVVKAASTPKYWSCPLTNFISDVQENHPALNHHPLRLQHSSNKDAVKSDLASDKQKWQALLENRLIVFEHNEQHGFIELLPDYDNRKKLLLENKFCQSITAIMVGAVQTPIELFDMNWHWFPDYFLDLLCIATGGPISTPWIELRNDVGDLVSRIHPSFRNRNYSKSVNSFDESYSSSIGKLLTCASNNDAHKETYFRAFLRYVVEGGTYQHPLEDRLVYLFRALDFIARKYKTSTQNLLDFAHQNDVPVINAALNEAADKIQNQININPDGANINRINSLNRIVARVKSAHSTDREFGIAVLELLKKMGLKDGEILEEHTKNSPLREKRTWSQLLSYYRGITIHEGYFDIQSGDFDIKEIFKLSNHLHDILVRILLKMIDYDGTYMPTVSLPKMPHAVDWVNSDTSIKKLGY